MIKKLVGFFVLYNFNDVPAIDVVVNLVLVAVDAVAIVVAAVVSTLGSLGFAAVTFACLVMMPNLGPFPFFILIPKHFLMILI